MSDPGFDDPMTDEELLDQHYEKPSLDALREIAQQMQQAVQGMRVLVQQNAEIIKALAADRVTEAVGRDGRTLKAISRIKG